MHFYLRNKGQVSTQYFCNFLNETLLVKDQLSDNIFQVFALTMGRRFAKMSHGFLFQF